MRSAAVVAEVGGGDWRDAVNALRPGAPELWGALPEAEQRRFLDRLARFWDVHRHRLAPQVAAAVDELRGSGRLTLLSARIRAVASHAGWRGGESARTGEWPRADAAGRCGRQLHRPERRRAPQPLSGC